jgi:membrane associated rhomboid family serine protease
MSYSKNMGSGRTGIFNTGNPLVMLIVLQVIFFIILNFIKSIYTFSSLAEAAFLRNIYHWFILPAEMDKLITRPWTLITMMFAELKTLTVISNLIWLWTFGYLVQDLLGNDKIIPIYSFSAFSAGITFLLATNLAFTGNTAGIFFNGAAAAVMGLAVAAATLSPAYRIFPMLGGGIPLWVITAVYVVLQVSALGRQPILLLPMLAAGVTGFVFISRIKDGSDPGAWLNRFFDWSANLFTPGKKSTAHIKQASFYQSGTREPYTKKPNITQQRVDALLDKINQEGYEKLTAEEKAFLKQASKKI